MFCTLPILWKSSVFGTSNLLFIILLYNLPGMWYEEKESLKLPTVLKRGVKKIIHLSIISVNEGILSSA